MQSSTPDQEKLLIQMAIRQASRGRGSTLFHLLLPISIFVCFCTFFIVPALLLHYLTHLPDWLVTLLTAVKALTVIAPLALYNLMRRHRLNPIIVRLRSEKTATDEPQSVTSPHSKI